MPAPGPADPRLAAALGSARRAARGLLRRRLGPRARIESESAEVEREVARLLAEAVSGREAPPDLERRASLLAYDVAEKLLRRLHPSRWRLRSRLRYTLTHHPVLALWLDRGRWVAGLADWEGQPAGAPPPRGVPQGPPSELPSLAGGVLTAAGHPVALDDLVEALAPGAPASATPPPAAPPGPPAHPAYEELAGFVDGVLDPAPHEAMAAHLQACAPCAEEAEELRQAWGALLSPALPTPTMPIAVQRPGLWARVRGLARRVLGR
jgi:hypothetical protein